MSDKPTELDFLYDRLDYCIWNGEAEGVNKVQEEIDRKEANS